MTSFNPIHNPEPVGSPSTPSTGKQTYSTSESKATKNGRSYMPLSSIQRLSRLVKIISKLLVNAFGLTLSPQDAYKVAKWWYEFKKGRVVKVAKSSGEPVSPSPSPSPSNLRKEDIAIILEHVRSMQKAQRDAVKSTNRKTPAEQPKPSQTKQPLPQGLSQKEAEKVQKKKGTEEEAVKIEEAREESPQTDTQPAKEQPQLIQEEDIQKSIQDEERDQSQFGSEGHDQEQLEKHTLLQEESSQQVIASEGTEKKKSKQKEPVLNIKPKERAEEAREESPLVEAQPLSQELSQKEVEEVLKENELEEETVKIEEARDRPPVVETKPLLQEQPQLIQEEDIQKSIQDEERDQSQFGSEGHDQEQLEKHTLLQEESSQQVIAPEGTEKKQLEKEPVLTINPKERAEEVREESPHRVEAEPILQDQPHLVQEEELHKSVEDEGRDQSHLGSEAQNQQEQLEKSMEQQETPIDKQEDALNIQEKPVLVEEVLETEVEVVSQEENTIELIRKEDEIAMAEKIKTISSVLNDENVKNWLKIAEKNPLLSRTDLYQNLHEISIKLAPEIFADDVKFKELLIKQYTDYEDKILAIKNAPEDLAKLIQKQENESVFHILDDAKFSLSDIAASLKDLPNGKFKGNLQALLKLILNPTPESSPVMGRRKDQSLEKSIILNEAALEAVLKKTDPAKAFADFEDQINQNINQSAKEAFIIFTEILKAGATRKNIHLKLREYNEAEAVVQKAIIDLAEPLQVISKDTLNELPKALDDINKIFKSLPDLNKKPFLKNLLIQNTSNVAKAYLLLENRNSKTLSNDPLSLKLALAIFNLKTHLGAENKERLNFVIDLGKEVLAHPEKAFNQYLETEGVLRFTQNPPLNSSSVEEFLKSINDYVDQKTYTTEELLALEAFTSVALYSYIINPQSKIDSSFQPIAEILTTIRTKIEVKLTDESIKIEAEKLRKNEQNQNFYKFLQRSIENTPSYPKDFWLDPKAIEKMTIADSVLRTIGAKIAAPNTPPDEPAQLVHKNDLIGYEIYFYPAASENEKPKLLLFLTKHSGSATLQGMNHQLGLFGDPEILKSAQEVLSNITSTDILEGYQQDLKEGNLDIIASGFDNSGAAASVVANKLALLYPKTIVTSISAGSTTIVTTEDAYNMNQAENFFPIRLKYVRDGSVDRTIAHLMGDFSEESYHTFPLLVKYNLNAIDINKHNKEEYGNVNNFIPAMTNPLILRGLYQEISSHISYEPEKEIVPTRSLSESLLGSILFDYEVIEPQQRLYIGQLDDLIELGNHVRDNIEDYKDAFLKLDQQKLSTSDKSKQMQEFEKTKEVVEEPQGGIFGFLWKGKQPTHVPVVQKNVLTVEEQNNTILALRQATIYLKDPKVMALITPEKAISLLVAADMLLINYTKINTNVGKLPQLVDLIGEIRELASKRLEALYQNEETKEKVASLLHNEGFNLEILANRVLGVNTQYQDLFGKKDILGKIDYEDRFLEYLGFKIAMKGQDKLGSEPYVSKLYTNNTDNFDISLFTPEERNKKQRIVISCNGPDALGKHQVLPGEFGAGDSAIISRAEHLKKLISTQLKEQFAQHHFDAKDVDIVVTGFGSEGAVATAIGYFLAEEFEDQGCQVQSVGFGAPRFTTKEGADLIRNQPNFAPIRFLSPSDKRSEWKISTVGDFELSHDTYYTIPFQFRIVGALEIGGHNTNLYGDIQGIKTSMKTAYNMRDVANEKDKTILKKAPAKETVVEQVSLPTRISLDTRKALLIDFSEKSVDELKKVEPGKLIRIMKYCVELSESDEISEKEIEYIQKFFNAFIEAIKNDDINENHSIQNAFFKKMVAHGYKPNQLFGGKWKIQQIISKNVEVAMQAVMSADQKLDAKTKDELILNRDYYRGILAGDLNGNRYKPAGGGVNGAVFFRHLESGLKTPDALLPDEKAHRPFLGVFKPHPETVREFKGWFDATQWGERIKAVAGMDSHLNKDDPNYRVNNEIFAYELFHVFGFNSYVGFPTTLKFINKNDTEDRPASFCSFIPGLDIVALHVKEVSKGEAKSNTLDKKRHYSDQELHIWQMSKIFDFLTGNMDGHEGNAFVKVDQQDKVIGAVNFDYDKAFAVDSPTTIGNQYKWANLKISKHDFSQATKEALTKMFMTPDAEEKILAFLTKARGDISDKTNFTDKQEALLRKRIEVLKKIASGEIQQLSDLKDYKSIKLKL